MKKRIIISLIFILALLSISNNKWNISAATRIDKEVTADSGDSSTEIQKLLDYNKYGKYNLTIRIPAGTYELLRELRIFSNTTIIADSNARLMKNHLKGALLANDLSNDEGGYLTTENITIIGGIWDSSKIADIKKGTESFRFIHATNVTVNDATICNVPENSHLLTFAGVKNGIVNNCTLYGYVGTSYKEAIHLDIVHDDIIVPSMQTKYLVYDDLACDGITITNTEISDYPRGIGSHSSVKGVYHKNITISKNNLHNLDEAAIKAYNYINLEISDNLIHNTGLGILVYTHITKEEDHYLEALTTTKKEEPPENYNIVIKGNTIQNISQISSVFAFKWGDAIRILGNDERPLSGVTIENNRIMNADRYGLFLQNAPNSTIAKNQITSTKKNGIYLIKSCNNSIISGNKVIEAGTSGSIEGGIGILASNQVTISDNTIKSPAKNGIFLYSQSNSCTITHNGIISSGENGIALYQQSNDAVITSNTISNYGKYGVFAYKIGSATINSNTISAKSGNDSVDGIHIAGDRSNDNEFIIKENTICSSNRYGMYLSNAPRCYVGSNSIADTVKNALYLDNTCNNSSVYYNQIFNAGKTGSQEGGIGISKSKKVLIYMNTVRNAANNGISLYNGSTICTVKANSITSAGNNAISVSNSSNYAKITYNIIKGSKALASNNRGIFVYAANYATITNNTITRYKLNQDINTNYSTGSMERNNTIN